MRQIQNVIQKEFGKLRFGFSFLRENENIYPCLFRDFMRDRLYHPDDGYFCKPDFQVGRLQNPIDFSKLFGFSDYVESVAKLYPKNAWLTPSEIFQPYFGYCIGTSISNYHMETYGKGKSLNLIEIGPGTGTAAISILDYFWKFQRSTYQSLSYTLVEISKPLCNVLKTRLELTHPNLMKSGRVKIINSDIMNYPHKHDALTYFLMFEVLDNLPHDKIVLPKNSRSDSKPKQAIIKRINGTLKEEFEPINDEIINEAYTRYLSLPSEDSIEKARLQKDLVYRIFQYYNEFWNKNTLYLPTGALQLFKRLNEISPNHHLIGSDFDMLSGSIGGINAPIVSKKLGLSFEKEDMKTYLNESRDYDIFFPTDFRLIRHFYEGVNNKRLNIDKNDTFLSSVADPSWCRTESGYNPMIEDFRNTTFFSTF